MDCFRTSPAVLDLIQYLHLVEQAPVKETSTAWMVKTSDWERRADSKEALNLLLGVADLDNLEATVSVIPF